MNTSKPTLTAVQQGTEARARQFHASGGDPGRPDAVNLGAALAHIQLLLDIISDLTADGAS